ncbi:anti-sigma factor domain-containing protein [Fictibacillus nanhaiensis]|uniref:anti-sigma-I factor RsgI family protein n=1 Tax=Fictibacillus nanhaiensis TaxID=742169 RepID=UPI001C98D866|nr:anti-sigma factor domain-containing protein [Fictibacillus nanhaiensis]MBY6035032.1 anti-sigma factor domain-containing protein [Fictibacillus nanhaiensis]
MKKAIIVEVSNRHLIVLAEGGEFKKIKNTNTKHTVGQEITIPALQDKKNSLFSVLINWKTGTAAALAILLLFFQVLSPMSGQGAYAFVGMDMDPSLELKINEDMQVLDIYAFNDQGHKVLEHMDEWKEKDIAYVTNLIFETCEDLGYLTTKEEVLITTTLSEEIPEDKKNEMKERVNKVMKKTAQKKSVEMTTIVMSSKERDKAKKMKISPGHYAIYTAARNSGIKISKKDISGHTIEEISEKVGPIKELLEENETAILSKNENEKTQVFEPPLPILDKKTEEKAAKEKTNLPIQEVVKAVPKIKMQERNDSIRGNATKKEEKVSKPAKKEQQKEIKEPLIAEVPEKEVRATPPPNDVPAVTLTKVEQPKEEKPKEIKMPKVEPDIPVQSKPVPLPEPKEESWIYIDILIDGMIITVKIEANTQLLKEDLTKKALALIDQNLIIKHQKQTINVLSEDIKQEKISNSFINDQTEPQIEQKAS